MKNFTFIMALVMSMLSFTNAKADKLPIRYGESSIYAYGTNSVENAYDGYLSTKFWSNGSPQAGYTFTVFLNSSANVGDIKLYFADGDLPTDGAVIEVNENNSDNWVQVGEPLTGVQANDVVTRNAGGVYTKQIRLRFTQASAFWFQLLEFEVYEYEVAIQERTISAVAGEGGSVTINGGSVAVAGTEKVQLVATPDYGYKFVNWTVDGEVVSTSAEYTDNTDGNKEYVANFAKFADAGEWYASIDKPTFGEAGNTTYIKSATLTDGVEAEVAGIPAEIGQTCVTNAIEVAPGAEFNLNLTYKLNWGDLAIYQLDNDGATKEYGYYFGSWEANGSTAKVAQNIKDAGVSVTEVVDEVCTATFPIRINENHNPGDVIVVRAITGVINDAANSAFEKNITEGGYVDFLFVVSAAEKAYTLNVTSAGYATMYVDFNAAIAEGVEAYIVKTEGIKGEYIVMTPITGTIPANTGVIVNAAEGDYVFNASEENIANVDGNLLLGSVADEYVEGAAYVLCDKNGIGLYKTILNKNATGGDGETHFKNNANKAYLPASAVPNKSVEFYGFDWSGTTGISEVKGENGNVKAIFDLTGRKVNSITAPGIYIVNGNKVLVK